MDARSTERVNLDVSVAYSFETYARGERKSPPYRWGSLLNISERGLCFKANDRFPVRQILSLYLKLSDETSGIKMLGKICWTATDWDGSTRIGIQFIGTLPGDWRRLIIVE
jgi:hypothetical protein